jgi:hypothetical protein
LLKIHRRFIAPSYHCGNSRVRVGRKEEAVLETEETLRQLLVAYKEEHRDELSRDPEFARWLEEDYAPIAGGWHY